MNMQSRNWFILPPIQEYYYRRKHPGYATLPPFKEGCAETINPMEWIYPRDINRIFIPQQLDGTHGEAIFELAHRDHAAEVHWFLNQSYIGSTQYNHQMSIKSEPGLYSLTVSDQHGNQLKKSFTLINTRD
jgi:penicillin-binding protein 1C